MRLEGRVVFVLDAEAIVAAMNPALSVKMDENRAGSLARPQISHHSMPMIRSASGVSWRICSRRKGDSTLPRPTTGRSLELCCCATSNRRRRGQQYPHQQSCARASSPISKCPISMVSRFAAISGRPSSQGYPRGNVLLAHFHFPGSQMQKRGRRCQFVAKPDLQGISDKMYELIRANQGPIFLLSLNPS